jgi:hypothetical protein
MYLSDNLLRVGWALVQFGKYEQSSPDRDSPQKFEKIERLKSRVILNQLPGRKSARKFRFSVCRRE